MSTWSGDGVASVRTKPLFQAEVAVDTLHRIGGPAGAAVRVAQVPGGRFEGARLRGTILPGGSDWQTERLDGVILLDARIVLRTEDDALIGMTYGGLRHGPAEVMRRLASGEAVSPDEYYFRTAISFSTADPRYEWLNRVAALGIGERTSNAAIYQVHEVL
jgi:hypothetical protein